MASTARTARPLAANRALGRAALCGGCVALAVASLALPSAPSYDPWAWLVFGKELATPGLGFSTIAHTGWKPLAVLFTAPLALAGSAAPSLWLVVVRVAGLAALTLAFRLAARAGGRIAGVLAALALLAGSDWLRYLSAGNVEPLVVALMLGAIELHLRARRGGAFLLVALAGLARPEVWLLVIAYATYILLSERRWWPLVLGVPGMFALWIVPDWLGSGDLLHTFHLARISAEPRSLQGTRGSCAGAPARRCRHRGRARVDRCAVRPGLGLARPRSHRRRARSGRGGVGAAHRRRHGDGLPGGPPLPRGSRGDRVRARRDRVGGRHAAGVPAARPRCAGGGRGRRERPVRRLTRHRSRAPGGRVQSPGRRGLRTAGARSIRPGAWRPSRGCTRCSSPMAWPTAWPGSSGSRWTASPRGSRPRPASPSSPATIAPSSRGCGAATRRRCASRPRPRGMCCWCGGGRRRQPRPSPHPPSDRCYRPSPVP